MGAIVRPSVSATYTKAGRLVLMEFLRRVVATVVRLQNLSASAISS
jgi:hypothetical protein